VPPTLSPNIGKNKNDFNDGVLDGDSGNGNGVGVATDAAVAMASESATAHAPSGLFTDSSPSGTDSVTDLKWGRWALQFDPDNPAHYVADSQPGRVVTLPIEGTQDYELAGGTAPTDNRGNTGTLDGGSLTADFTHQTVTNTINITIGGDTWQATGNGSINTGTPVFSGSYNVTRGSGPSGNGDFRGFFGGAPLPSGTPSGAGVGYILKSGDITVDGAAAFRAEP
jgi:hypothetical protein